MKKRFISLFLAIMMVLSLCGNVFANVIPTYDKTKIKAGEDVVITVTSDETMENVSSFEYWVFFDTDKFDFKEGSNSGCVKGTANDNKDDPTTLNIQYSNVVERNEKKCIVVSIVDSTSTGLKIPAGKLMTLTFTAKKDIASDTKGTFEIVKGFVKDSNQSEINKGNVNTKTDIEIESGLKTFTVNVAPTTVEVKFYKDGSTVELSSEFVKDNGTVEIKNGNNKYKYHQYVLKLENGKYYYRGTDGTTYLGGDSFTVSDNTDELYIIRDNVRYNSTILNKENDYSFSFDNEPDLVLGTAYVTSNIRYTPTLLHYMEDGTVIKHTVTAVLNEKNKGEYYLTNDGKVSTSFNKTLTSAQTLNLPIVQYKIIKVTAPNAADTSFYSQEKNFLIKTVNPDSTIENNDGTKTYIFKSTAQHSNYEYRSMMEGKVTQAGYIKDGDNITVTFPNDRFPSSVYGTMSSTASDDNSVLLNVNSRNKLSLNVGETFKLRAYRAAWQIINTTTGNIMIEPDFHYEILSGKDVISIETTEESSKGTSYCNGNATGNWMNVKALKEGTAIVSVYYDAIDVYGANPSNSTGITVFGATNPDRYGVMVVNVGKDGNITWNPVSEDENWDAEFDTVYYTGNNGVYSFAPSENVKSVKVQNVLGTVLGDAKDVKASADGKYDVPVYTGANIIAVETENGIDYQVVRAKEISYTIKNETTGISKVNGAPEIKLGDKIKISFDRIDMPIPKISGIYNPGYMGTGKTAYYINDDVFVTSAGSQYDAYSSAKSSITFTATIEGLNSLKGYLDLSSMGSDFGEHRNIDDNGVPANLNASEKFGKFGKLPDINFNVLPNSDFVETYEEVTDISGILIYGGMNTYQMSFSLGNINANTGKPSGKPADAATAWKSLNNYNRNNLNAKVISNSLSNKIELRYWYDGEEVKSVKLNSGVSTVIDDFVSDSTKILYLQVVVTPNNKSLGEAKTFNYVVYPDNGDRNKIHPIIQSLSVSADGNVPTVKPTVNYADTNYVIDVNGNKSITLNAKMLVGIYNTATKTDMSDKVTVELYKSGEIVGDSIEILKGGEPTNPNRDWNKTVNVVGADELQIEVTSYCDDKYKKTYSFKLTNVPDPLEEAEKGIGKVTFTASEEEEGKAETVISPEAALLIEDTSLEIKSTVASIKFDKDATKALCGDNNTNITIGAEEISAENLPPETLKAIADLVSDSNVKKAIELTAENENGENLFKEGSEGSADITIPMGSSPEEGKTYAVYYVSGTNAEKINSKYENEKLTFTAEHFSTYVVNEEALPPYKADVNVSSELVAIGDKVKVSAVITGSKNSFNAYDIQMKFDADKYVVSSDTDVANQTITIVENIIEITGYGEGKEIGSSAFEISFKAKRSGETKFEIVSAKIDESKNAITKDAQNAEIGKAEKVNIAGYKVVLPEGWTGNSIAEEGKTYEFTVDNSNYVYDFSKSRMGEKSVEVIDIGEGKYQIKNVDGEIILISNKKGKEYNVTITGSGKSSMSTPTNYNEKATYGTDYIFTLPKDSEATSETNGMSYSVKSVTINGIATDTNYAYNAESRTGTIKGSDIIGDVEIEVIANIIEIEQYTAKIEGTGSADAKLDRNAVNKGGSVTLTLTPTEGYQYTVSVKIGGNEASYSKQDNNYIVSNVKGDVVFTVSKEITMTTGVVKYLKLNTETDLYLVTVARDVSEGKTLSYDGNQMFWSEKYNTYCYLVFSADIQSVKTDCISEITEGKKSIDYSGDVNITSLIDINDAQLTYDFYKPNYEGNEEGITIEKLLRADVNGDKTVNVNDAVAIINMILN